MRRALFTFILVAVLSSFLGHALGALGADSPTPLLKRGQPVGWWFVYKFNSGFPGCGGDASRQCPFGGNVQPYKAFGQQYVYASSENASLQKGAGCTGATIDDPVGATFAQVYNGPFFYVFWNDQYYGDPRIRYPNCTDQQCGSPWGHSKGMLSWNADGEGLVMQVTTPSWPASAAKDFPRKSGNTLGCITKPNNVVNAQHFFAVKLTKDDLLKVLAALQNASVVTKLDEPKIVKNGGPQEVQTLVAGLGKKSTSIRYTKERLSEGVELISKPSDLHAPPWQMVSAVLGGVSLRTATWWAYPQIPTTSKSRKIGCWDQSLGRPGRVEVATTGVWDSKELSLVGGANHAKLGVSISGTTPYSIFGDLNQQGAITGTAKNCMRSQNGRGGLFFVLNNKALHDDLSDLVDGDTAPTKVPSKPPGK